MVGKQFSVSVINLATSINSNRINNNPSLNNDSTLLNLLDQRKHALSEENLPTTVSSISDRGKVVYKTFRLIYFYTESCLLSRTD
jgi:hypothetical protein